MRQSVYFETDTRKSLNLKTNVVYNVIICVNVLPIGRLVNDVNSNNLFTLRLKVSFFRLFPIDGL